MEYKLITPMALWSDYNPTKEPLEVTVDGVVSTEKYISKEMSFTVESVSDGKIRGHATVVVQRNKVSPTIMYIPAGEAAVEKTKFFEVLIDRGFNFVIVDYGGYAKKKGKKYTSYPESLSYCVFSKNRNLPYRPAEVTSSPWYWWMKVVRRAITLVFEEANVDTENLFLLGYLEGAQLAWKVAGIDGRVRATIPVGACGYTEFFNRFKYDESSAAVQFSDEWECYLAGISSQAYAKLLMCPVYFMSGTNSTYADIDRVADIFGLVPTDEKYMSFSAGTNNSIEAANYMGAVAWMEQIIKEGHVDLPTPEVHVHVSEGKLYATVTGTAGSREVDVYYALDEVKPPFRSWQSATEIQKLTGDELLVSIAPREESERLFIFATATYDNGVLLSSPELYVDLRDLDIEIFDTTARVINRFIYYSSMDEIPFSVENFNPIVKEDILTVKTGPHGIKGFATSEGKLCTYKLEPPHTRGDEDYILQMEAYSENARTIEIIMYTAEEGSTKYIKQVQLTGTSGWQRINLTRNCFKNAELKTLADWRVVRKMKIKDAENVIFNNILWI